ncbi:MAG TPA: hypothetical protein VFU15_07580 [Bacteroidia bacterium]|nr:hypothetical protein [Bacteroidia bacterium]
MTFRKLLPALAFVACSFVSGSGIVRQDFDYDDWGTQPLDLGKNGVLIEGHKGSYTRSGKSLLMARIDINGKLAWNKEIVIPNAKKSEIDYECASNDGNSIYVLSFTEEKKKGGGQNPVITRVDTSGNSTSKSIDVEDFGFVITMYANSKYLFVITAIKDPGWEDKLGNDVYKLYRFSKNDLSIEDLGDNDLCSVAKDDETFWQVFRVNDDYMEAFKVLSTDDHAIAVELGRFDEKGKLTTSKDIDIKLEKSFTRWNNSGCDAFPGVMNWRPAFTTLAGGPNGVVYTKIRDGISRCHVIYDEINKCYLIFGITGPKAQVRIGAVFNGFFIQEVGDDYTPGKMKEFSGFSDIDDDKLFNINSVPEGRYMDVYMSPGHHISVSLHGGKQPHSYYIDENELTLTQNVGQWILPGGDWCPAPGDYINYATEYTSVDTKRKAFVDCIRTLYGQLTIFDFWNDHKIQTLWEANNSK